MVLSRAVLAAALTTTVLAGAPAARAAGPAPGFEPKSAAAARTIRLQRQAIDLINRADRRVRARRASCRPELPDPEPRTTQDVPTQAVLDTLAPLRRPATADDPAPSGPLFGSLGEVYVNQVRGVTAANGQRFTIVVARREIPFLRISGSCLDAQHAELTRLLAGKTRAVQTIAREQFAELRRQQEEANAMPPGPQDGVYLFTRTENGSGGDGGGGAIEYFRTHGNFTSSGGERGATLSGLLPDGVATITLEYPRRVSRGPLYKPTVYPSAFTRTVRVQENVVSLRVPRGAGDAFPPRMVWRDAAGNARCRLQRRHRRGGSEPCRHPIGDVGPSGPTSPRRMLPVPRRDPPLTR